jgi:hypothetical protein
LLAVAVAAAAGSVARGSTFVKADVPALDRMSEAVVHARVVGLASAWDPSHRMIFTHVTLEVLGSLRGDLGQRFDVRVPGGTVDGFTAQMIGAPEFDLDEEVLVFLDRWPDGELAVAGYFQGKSRVVRDRAGNAVLTGGSADGMPLAALAERLAGPAGGER